MDQAIDAGQHLGKRAEGHELDDGDLRHIADLEGRRELGPGVAVGILVAEGDLVVLRVEADDVDIDLVADGQHVGRLLDAAPAQLGDVDHAVNAADVDERTIGRQGLDNTVIVLADLDLAPDLLGALAALLLGDGTDGTDDALAAAVDLGDLQTHSLADELGHGSVLRQAGLGSGHKHADALDGHNDAALVVLGNFALDDLAALLRLFNGSPVLHGIETLLGEHRSALNVVDADNARLNGVADVQDVFDLDAVVGELAGRDEAGILGADIDTDLGARNGHDRTGYLFSIIYRLERCLQHFIKIFSLRGIFLSQDLVTHLLFYLLNDPCRHGGPGCQADRIRMYERACIKLRCVFNKLHVCARTAADLVEMAAVGAMAAADDDHCIARAGHLRGLCLTCKRSTTYCIKQFCVCTLFFYDFLTFQQFLLRLGRLNDDSQRFCTVDGAVGDARGKLRGVIDHDRGGTPAADGAHLRVVGCTDDDRLPPLGRSLGHDLMDALDLRTRRVIHRRARALHRLKLRTADAVGADDDGRALRDLLRPVHDREALRLQVAHHIVVMDELAETVAVLLGGEHFLGHLHRPADAEAETGRLGNDAFLHVCASSPKRARIAAHTASMLSLSVRSLVSMHTASAAALSGATARCVSS